MSYNMQQLPGMHRGLRWCIYLMLFLLLAYCAIGTVSATLAANPILSYDWSSDNGNTVVDGSGNGNTGTNYNTILSSTSNGYKYRTFDTSGTYILVHPSSSLDPTTITVEAIFSSRSTGEHQTICLQRDYPNNGFWYGIDLSGEFYFYVLNNGVDRSYLTNINVTDGNVHYITATYDGQVMNFYDFGVLKDRKDWGSAMSIGKTPSYLYVGTPPGDHPFGGNLYLLRITNRALSSAEVLMNVNNDRARATSTNSGYTISLNIGWNLISLPVLNSSIWSSQLGNYGIRRVSLYNNNKGGFDTYVIGFSSADKDIQLKNGLSYFLDAEDKTSIVINGVSDGPRDVTVYPGWNAVGWSGLSTIKASDLGGRLSSIQRICRYNNANGAYDTYVVGFSSTDKDFDIKPGEGYLVDLNASSAGTLRIGG